MARYSEWESGGEPVEVVLVSRGYVLVDVKGRIVTDEYGEPYTYSFRHQAEAAMARRG